jgi:uncharacterized protein (TIGR02284 family)
MSSTDAKVTKDLIETLEDGREGFTTAAGRLAESGRTDIAGTFREYAAQRARFASELRQLAAQYGDRIEEDSSLIGALHRGWMAIKDAVSSDEPGGVLDAAEQGEDHAKKEYASALREDISPHLRTVVQRQADAVGLVHEQVRSLRDRVG